MHMVAQSRRTLAVFLAAALLVGAVFAQQLMGQDGVKATNIRDFELPGQGGLRNELNAAVSIKTQKAADNIKNGIRGIDVSKYQGEINWKKVAADNVEFAFIRATCGTYIKGVYHLNDDPMFVKNAKAAHQNGIKVGAYHYACLTSEARMRSEAKAFIKQLKKVDITYPVVLDVESNPGRLSKSELSRLSKGFADIVKAEGYTVMIYSYHNFFRDNLDISKLGNYKLWVAHYSETPKNISHSAWQHTSFGRVDGIKGNVDINIVYPGFEPKVWKPVTVSKDVAEGIKSRLRQKYHLSVPEEGMSGIQAAIFSALTMEINKQFKENLRVNGKISDRGLQLLGEIKFIEGRTKGNITYLIQARLFCLGYYKTNPTAKFDKNTVNSIKAFQKANNLVENGELNRMTLETLLR